MRYHIEVLGGLVTIDTYSAGELVYSDVGHVQVPSAEQQRAALLAVLNGPSTQVARDAAEAALRRI
jgi:hypothetical protein